MASGQTVISRLTTAEPSPPGATEDKGIGTDKNLTIKGGGTVEASSADGEAIWSGGNINISDGSQVKASSEKDAAVEAKGSLAATNASLNANGVEYGVYAHQGHHTRSCKRDSPRK